jgi:hypothetical protein
VLLEQQLENIFSSDSQLRAIHIPDSTEMICESCFSNYISLVKIAVGIAVCLHRSTLLVIINYCDLDGENLLEAD